MWNAAFDIDGRLNQGKKNVNEDDNNDNNNNKNNDDPGSRKELQRR